MVITVLQCSANHAHQVLENTLPIGKLDPFRIVGHSHSIIMRTMSGVSYMWKTHYMIPMWAPI